MKRMMIVLAMLAACELVEAETVVDVSGVGAAKSSVEIHVSNPTFVRCLQRNLELSGLFQVGTSGSIKVAGVPGAIRAEGQGKVVSSTMAFADAKSAISAARKLSDDMCQAFGNQKGFANDRIMFLKCGKASGKADARPSELCVGYADGFETRQLTSDAKMTVFPRWHYGSNKILYISNRNGAPQIWEMDLVTNQRRVRWSFKGTPTGIAVSPDGTKVAAILSFQGNPELYLLTGDRYVRLTNTPLASEGQPTWSPDGRKIAYVSDETRHPQIYVVDVATKQKRRLTSRGSQNTDPDWGADGRITYVTRRGGGYIAVMQPATGDSDAQLVTDAANWEHPSWSRDMRHLVANRNGALFVIDTLEDGDKPRQIPIANGNWISPTWSK